MDKLTAMQTFVRVVDAGGFTRAADALGVPKARVSQRIADLERTLGVRLLHRTTRAVRPTEDGRIYHAQCVRLLDELEEAERSLRGEHRPPEGVLRVEVVASVARHVLAPALPAFRARWPQVTVRLGSSDRPASMIEDGIDCAIRGGELADSSLVARRLCEVSFGLYAARDCLGRKGPPATPADLAALPRLGAMDPRTGESLPWTLTRGAASRVLDKEPVATFDDGDALLAACVAGCGVAAAPPFAVADAVRRRVLVPVLPQWHAGVRPLSLVYPSRRHQAPRVRCFADWASELLSAHPALALTPAALAASSA